MNTLKIVDISRLLENVEHVQGVDRTHESYRGLVESIRKLGLLVPLLVRPKGSKFQIIDGLHRYCAAADAGVTSIPVRVHEMTDDEVHESQIISSVHRMPVSPVQYAQALLRMAATTPTDSIPVLAARLSKSPSWVVKMLRLGGIHPKCFELMMDGKIVALNCYALSRLPLDEQWAYLDKAMVMDPREFNPIVMSRLKEWKDAHRRPKALKP